MYKVNDKYFEHKGDAITYSKMVAEFEPENSSFVEEIQPDKPYKYVGVTIKFNECGSITFSFHLANEHKESTMYDKKYIHYVEYGGQTKEEVLTAAWHTYITR